MTQFKNFSFGVDHITMINSAYNVFRFNDPQKCEVNLSYETTVHRGGDSNEVRAIAIHSRTAEVALGTGSVDAELAQLLTGGTITSLGTSAASITTGSASGVNSLFGGTDTIASGISTVTINSPTLIKTSDYYLKATATDGLTVTRVNDGKVFTAVTLTNSAAGLTLDSERGIVFSTTASATSLTVNEKAYISARTAISIINQKIAFDTNQPCELTVRATVDYCGYERQINIPVSKPTGSVQMMSPTEFQVQDLTFPIAYDTILDELCDMTLQG